MKCVVELDIVGIVLLFVEVFELLCEKIVVKWIVVMQFVELFGFVICFDCKLLWQVLLNLIENLVKYMVGGLIMVMIMFVDVVVGQQLKIVVCDIGVGIVKQYLLKIFELFYCVNDVVGLYVDGIGMGFVVVCEIVMMLCGYVDVCSVVGEGSEFVVMLLVEVLGVDMVGMVVGDVFVLLFVLVYYGWCVLVVDDNDNVCEMFGVMLLVFGVDVDLCGIGQEGVVCFGMGCYDFVVFDFELLDLSGFDVVWCICVVV